MKRKITAFTLIEILVVMFILSIAMSFVAFNFRGGAGYRQKVEDVGGQLLMQLIWVQEKAVLEGKTLGVTVQAKEYQFREYIFDTQLQQWRWKALDQERLLKGEQMPDDIHLAIRVDSTDREENPIIIFYASGELTPFDIILQSERKSIQYRLQGKANGELVLIKGKNL